MKNILTLALVACATILFSQNVPVLPSFPSAADNPVWQVRFNGQIQTVTVGADTVICGAVWNPAVSTGMQVNQGLLGFYRIEEGSRVYYRETGSCADQEYLMYDFGVEVGDTVHGVYNFDSFGSAEEVEVVVISIIPFDINGNTYKGIYLRGYQDTPPFQYPFIIEWAEVVGSINHPFYPAFCLDQGSCHNGSQLLCLSANEGTRFVGFSHPDVTCTYEQPPLQRLYVNKHVQGGMQNGSSWSNAFSDLQDAIAIADAGDTIWVAQGTYLPTESTDREIYFELKQGVVIYGGFNATETAHEQRDWEANPTVLSGDIGVAGDSTDNSYHVFYTIGTDSTSRLDGFTISDGLAVHAAIGYFGHYNGGGGLFVDANAAQPVATPHISNCTFFRNTARYGGGAHLNYGANPVFRNCVFRENHSAIQGGGMYKAGPIGEGLSFVLEDCVFERNRTESSGGGLSLDEGCDNYLLRRCFFRGNYSVSIGGGIFYNTSCKKGTLTIEDCHFEENEALDGGGIGYSEAPMSGLSDDPVAINITRSVFRNNKSGGGAAIEVFHHLMVPLKFNLEDCLFQNNNSLVLGAGLYFLVTAETSSDVEIKNCVFTGNTSTAALGAGGAVWIDAFSSGGHNRLLVANSLFLKNSGALRLGATPGVLDASLRNCTFYDNGRRPFAKVWSPNFTETNYVAMGLENCIIWEPDKLIENMFYNGSNTAVLNGYTFRNSLLSLPACDLPGGLEACAENNLFNLYPQFLDTLAGDFRLAACSPAINAGTYAGLDTLGIFQDLNGEARVQEGIADMGAYERPAFTLAVASLSPVSCPGATDGSVFFETTGDAPFDYTWESAVNSDTTTSQLPVGDYLFHITDAAGCSDTISISIPPADTIRATFDVQDASASDIVDGSITLLDIQGGTPPYTLLWDFFGSTEEMLSNLHAAIYNVTIEDSEGCFITQALEVSAPVAIEDIAVLKDEFSLWPNPATNSTILANESLQIKAGEGVFVCYDALGREVLRSPLDFTNKTLRQEIDLSQLAAGIHLCKVEAEGVILWQGKFVKQ